MWKLIKYELQTRKTSFYVFIWGILGWYMVEILLLYSAGAFVDMKMNGVFLFMFIPLVHVSMLLLATLLIFVNTYYFYRCFQNNNLSQLQVFPVKSSKTLFSKLITVIVEFFSIHFLYLIITVAYVGISIFIAKDPSLMSPEAISENGYSNLFGYTINLVSFLYRIFLFYIISILFLFSFLLLIRRITQNSKGYFWITILLTLLYLTFFMFIIYRYIMNSIRFNISLTSFSYLPTYSWWIILILFFFICSIFSLFIHWFYSRKTDF